ncbi:hypothetical protein B0T25DRAFT_220623 [Lasiosphaeria hispida]|uniref:F-box domain-containing protein n=1 Tax=Lasiosphaeria hispida TaxID=260671 RepID=A0AAJ0HJB3_9PEZI|nr:hypothetical protein B0T25DRAFT_220623 [Lasiosphaeria hispida]
MDRNRDGTAVCGVPDRPRSPNKSIFRPNTEAHETDFKTEEHFPEKRKQEPHPLMAAAHHNRTQSPLCRLPDQVLVRLMQLSDKVTVECLRRCSRLFLRLFPTACEAARDCDGHNIDRFPWPTSELSTFLPEEKTELLSLIAGDEYCKDCLAARHASNWQARVTALTKTNLHCSKCNADHPACLFSARERKKKLSKRICIGHQGHLRLCKHVKVPWSSITSGAEKRVQTAGPPAPYRSLVDCKRSSHVRACRNRRPFLDFLRVSAPKSSRTHTLCCPPHPIISCALKKSPNVPGTMALVLRILWSGHIGPLERGRDGRFQADELERGVKQLYQQQGRLICPQITPGPVAGSRLCGPGRCDCLEYAGKTTDWQRPPVEWRRTITCRARNNLGLSHGVDKKHALNKVRNTGLGGGLGERKVEFAGQCYSKYLWTQTPTGYLLFHKTEAIGCAESVDCVVVSYQSMIVLDLDKDCHLRRMNWNWYQALDPDSYDIAKDTEGFGLYWCKDGGCRNYYRFSRSRLRGFLKHADYVQSCPSGASAEATLDGEHGDR